MFDTEDYILFPFKLIHICLKSSQKWKFTFKYCCPGNLFYQNTCVADKLEHEEKYDGRIEELNIDTETSFLSALPSDEVDWVAS